MYIEPNPNGGFFSNCSTKLYTIINYLQEYKSLDIEVDSSQLWGMYKYKDFDEDEDITYHFFQPLLDISIIYKDNANLTHYQYMDYKTIDYSILHLLVRKYFTPSHPIITLSNNIMQKYNIDLTNSCLVYYRGTDKYKETKLASYADYINKMKEITNMKFLLLSDDEDFINKCIKSFHRDKLVIFDENTTSTCSDMGAHFIMKNTIDGYIAIKNLLALVYCLCKSNKVILCSNNVSMWIMLYREHSNNIIQYLNGSWL